MAGRLHAFEWAGGNDTRLVLSNEELAKLCRLDSTGTLRRLVVNARDTRVDFWERHGVSRRAVVSLRTLANTPRAHRAKVVRALRQHTDFAVMMQLQAIGNFPCVSDVIFPKPPKPKFQRVIYKPPTTHCSDGERRRRLAFLRSLVRDGFSCEGDAKKGAYVYAREITDRSTPAESTPAESTPAESDSRQAESDEGDESDESDDHSSWEFDGGDSEVRSTLGSSCDEVRSTLDSDSESP